MGQTEVEKKLKLNKNKLTYTPNCLYENMKVKLELKLTRTWNKRN